MPTRGKMNKQLWLASFIVILALDGCSPVFDVVDCPAGSFRNSPAGQGQAGDSNFPGFTSPVTTVSQGNSTPTVAPVPSPARTVQSITPNVYDLGKPTLRDVWLDPINGKDSNSGASRDQALRTMTAAWNRIPEGTLTTTGYRILLIAGDYAANTIRNGSRHAEAPRNFQSSFKPPMVHARRDCTAISTSTMCATCISSISTSSPTGAMAAATTSSILPIVITS